MNNIMKKIISHYLLIPISGLLSIGIHSFASAAACTQTLSSGANVATVVSSAAAGSTICLNAGTYTGNVTFSKSGTASAPITLIGIGSPVIRGNVRVTGSYNILDGVTISPPTAGGSAVNLAGQYNTLRNCLVTNYGASAGDQATAITLESGSAYNSVVGCTIRDLNDIDVFHVFGHDHIIRNNYVTNIKQLNYALNHTDFFQSWGWAGNSVYNIILEGNRVTNSSCQLGNTSNDNISTLHDITFRNNIFANITAAFFSGIPKTKFYNNIFYNVGDAQGYAVSYYNQNYYSSAGTEFKNNVFLENMGDIDNHSGVANVTIANNYFAGANYAAKSNTGAMGTSFVNGGNPKFVNLTGLDFHIQSGSVLIDKGANLSSSFTTDYDANLRSGTWDIGPYEFGGGSTITINPPENLRL